MPFNDLVKIRHATLLELLGEVNELSTSVSNLRSHVRKLALMRPDAFPSNQRWNPYAFIDSEDDDDDDDGEQGQYDGGKPTWIQNPFSLEYEVLVGGDVGQWSEHGSRVRRRRNDIDNLAPSSLSSGTSPTTGGKRKRLEEEEGKVRNVGASGYNDRGYKMFETWRERNVREEEGDKGDSVPTSPDSTSSGEKRKRMGPLLRGGGGGKKKNKMVGSKGHGVPNRRREPPQWVDPRVEESSGVQGSSRIRPSRTARVQEVGEDSGDENDNGDDLEQEGSDHGGRFGEEMEEGNEESGRCGEGGSEGGSKEDKEGEGTANKGKQRKI